MKIFFFGWVLSIRKPLRFKDSDFIGRHPSEDFEDAFSSHEGGSIRECACGRLYFNSDGGWDWEDGELERLQKLAIKDPEGYADLPYTVTGVEVNGQFFVDGCKCGHPARYERFLADNAGGIADYLNRRAKRISELARDIAENETVK